MSSSTCTWFTSLQSHKKKWDVLVVLTVDKVIILRKVLVKFLTGKTGKTVGCLRWEATGEQISRPIE